MKSRSTAFKLYCGLDVSGDTLDVCYQLADGSFEWAKEPNSLEGFKQIWKLTGKLFHFVMEATGIYQLPFCFFLEGKKAQYSVLNALQVKRYMQMKLDVTKQIKKMLIISACMVSSTICPYTKCPTGFILSVVHSIMPSKQLQKKSPPLKISYMHSAGSI